ncbi:WD40 repeat domain-containing protein [Phormidium sp. CCY1219]|uniref:WD40 repeat domain-containing protein n=1 Tax=Phormidium sp. CCY1219 TaxID=2886104 RepID=UPI002D1F51EA|nr:WD40 repeat domain-containing protein [Phormidium sp. CCY1219]MEB3830133.1 WD40 repeat domain-containing protein [Phormidium sp. CCY1219]
MDWENAQLICTLSEPSGPVATIAFTADGSAIAIGSCDSAVKLLQVPSGDRAFTLFGYPLGVNCIAMNPRSPLIAVGAPDGTVELWQFQERKRVGQFSGDGRVTAVAFNPDGTLIVTGSDNSFVDTLFATPAKKPHPPVEDSNGGTINIWGVMDGQLRKSLSLPDAPVNAIAISPQGQFFASGHRDDTIKLWHLPKGTLSGTLHAHADAVYSVAIGPDGGTLASGSGDRNIHIWQIPENSTLPQQPQLTLEGHTDVVYSLAISPDGNTLASGSGDGSIKLWDLRTGFAIATLNSESTSPPAVMSVAFSPDSHTLAAGSSDGEIKIWRIATAAQSAYT